MYRLKIIQTDWILLKYRDGIVSIRLKDREKNKELTDAFDSYQNLCIEHKNAVYEEIAHWESTNSKNDIWIAKMRRNTAERHLISVIKKLYEQETHPV